MSDPLSWVNGLYSVTCPNGCGWTKDNPASRYLRRRLDDHLKTCKKKEATR